MVCKAIADHTGFSATAGWSLCMPMLWPYMTLTYPIDRSVVYKKQNQWSLQNSEKNERIWRAKPAMKAMPWTGLLRASCTRQDTNIMYKTFGWFGCWCHHWRVVATLRITLPDIQPPTLRTNFLCHWCHCLLPSLLGLQLIQCFLTFASTHWPPTVL